MTRKKFFSLIGEKLCDHLHLTIRVISLNRKIRQHYHLAEHASGTFLGKAHNISWRENSLSMQDLMVGLAITLCQGNPETEKKHDKEMAAHRTEGEGRCSW